MKKRFKQILALIMALILAALMCGFGVSAEENDYGCREAFAKFRLEVVEEAKEGDFWNSYSTKNYYSSTSSEATPDYVLVYCCDMVGFAITSVILGDFVVRVPCVAYPYSLGIYVYTPEDNAIYTLTEAYKKDIKGVIDMVESCNVEYASVHRIGDVDKNGSINIKDATLIQKELAGIVNTDDIIQGLVYDEEYHTGFCNSYSDFNRDEKVNIRDATAIQKYLAKIKV